jgi:hypothetical protein
MLLWEIVCSSTNCAGRWICQHTSLLLSCHYHQKRVFWNLLKPVFSIRSILDIQAWLWLCKVEDNICIKVYFGLSLPIWTWCSCVCGAQRECLRKMVPYLSAINLECAIESALGWDLLWWIVQYCWWWWNSGNSTKLSCRWLRTNTSVITSVSNLGSLQICKLYIKWEQGAEGNIWTEEGWSDRRLEKTA